MKKLSELNEEIEKMYNTRRTFEDKESLKIAINLTIEAAKSKDNEDSPEKVPTLLNCYRMRIDLYDSDSFESALKDVDKVIKICPYDSKAYQTKAISDVP